MSELDDLLAACRAAPDDDGPRLVWADAVGGERGEFVVLQCRLAREDLPAAEAGALIRRHDELLAAHGKAWSGFDDESSFHGCVFRRGFVEAAAINVVAVPWERMFERMPLLASLHVRGISRSIAYHEDGEPQGAEPVAYLAAMLAQPPLQRLRGIELDDAYLHESWGETEFHFDITRYGDEVLELVARSGRLAGFRTFAIREHFTPRGLQALLSSSVLASVENLALEWGVGDHEQFVELFANLPNLRALEIEAGTLTPDLVALIPPSVVELSVKSIPPDGLTVLAASPVARSLERLAIHTTNLSAQAGALDAFPNVRALDLDYAGATPEAIAAFCRLRLPALRELRPFHELADESMLAIAESFGAQLVCVDVVGHEQLTCLDELRAKIAGHVRAGPYRRAYRPLVVGIDTREPWLRYGSVEGRY